MKSQHSDALNSNTETTLQALTQSHHLLRTTARSNNIAEQVGLATKHTTEDSKDHKCSSPQKPHAGDKYIQTYRDILTHYHLSGDGRALGCIDNLSKAYETIRK